MAFRNPSPSAHSPTTPSVQKYEDKAKAAREAYHAEIVKICGERGIPVPGEKTGKKRDASGAIKAPAGGKAAAAKAAADSDSDSTSSDDEAPKPPAAKKQIPAAGTSASSSSSASSKKKPAPPADSDSDSSDSSVDVKPAVSAAAAQDGYVAHQSELLARASPLTRFQCSQVCPCLDLQKKHKHKKDKK